MSFIDEINREMMKKCELTKDRIATEHMCEKECIKRSVELLKNNILEIIRKENVKVYECSLNCSLNEYRDSESGFLCSWSLMRETENHASQKNIGFSASDFAVFLPYVPNIDVVRKNLYTNPIIPDFKFLEDHLRMELLKEGFKTSYVKAYTLSGKRNVGNSRTLLERLFPKEESTDKIYTLFIRVTW